jgi:hypothetical protein
MLRRQPRPNEWPDLDVGFLAVRRAFAAENAGAVGNTIGPNVVPTRDSHSGVWSMGGLLRP